VSLSENDKRIIKALLESKGRVSSCALSKELEIPQATIQRRRKKLEAFIETSYSLRLEEFGLKLVTFLISVEGEISSDIGRLILLLPKITSVVSTIGSHVDLQAWAVIENNQDIFRLLEQIKQLQGVKAVLWVEQICNIGENRDTYTSIIRHN
jgi:DNA-binding Lrp family transcriptional regulator